MLAEMVIGLGLDATKLKQGLAESHKTISGRAKAMGSAMKSAGKTLTVGLTLPIIAMGGYALKASMDFNQAMGNVASLIPGNTARVEELKRGVQDLSIETGKSTDELAEGLYNVVSAFGDSADTMSIMRTNAKLAQGGLATLSESIALTSAMTKAYGDTSKAAVQKVSDLSTLTVRYGQTTLPELAAALPKVTALSAGLGVEQKELYAIMATATGVTGNAAEVATQLRGAEQALMAPTADAAKALEAQGYASGQAAVEALGLEGATSLLVSAAKESGKPLQSYISSIEGQTLASHLAGKGAAALKQNMKRMANAAGATDAAVKEQTTGMNENAFTMAQLKAQVQVLAQRLGDGLAPALSEALKAAEPIVDVVMDMADAFANASPRTQKIVVMLAALAAAIGPVLMVVGSAVSAFGTLAAAATALGIGVGALLGWIVVIVIAIAALVAAGIWLWKNWDTVKAKLADAWEAIKSAFSSAVDWIIGFVKGNWDKILIVLTGGMATVPVLIMKHWDKIKSTFQSSLNAVKSYSSAGWGKVKGITSGAWDGIKSAASKGASLMRQGVQLQFRLLTAPIRTALNIVKALVRGDFNGAKEHALNAVRNLASGVVGLLNKLPGNVGTKLASVVQKFRDAGTRLKDAFLDGVRALARGIRNIHIPLPHISVSMKKKAINNGPDIPYPSFDVDWYAKGGLFGSPGIIGVGDNPHARRDPEVVAPLSKLEDMLGSTGGDGMEVHQHFYGADVDQHAASRAAYFAFRSAGLAS